MNRLTLQGYSMGECFQKFWLALLLLVTVADVCVGQQAPAPQATTSMVAMSDQIKLVTDVYLPGDGKAKYPTIIMRTPYGKSLWSGYAGGSRDATRLRSRGSGR